MRPCFPEKSQASDISPFPLRILAVPVAFNEEKKIGSVFERFRGVKVDAVILIDDASTDQTPEIIRKLGYEVVSHTQRCGVGACIRTAIDFARKNGFDVLVVLAGNDKDRPHEIPRLLKPIIEEGYDFVQGSRYLPGGKFGKMPLYRQILTRWVHPLLFSFVSGMRITDSTNGFRAIRLSLFDDKRIDIRQSWLDQYELEPYVFFKTIRLGYKVKEVPVTKIYPPNALGHTKMTPITGWWSILRPLIFLGFGIKK